MITELIAILTALLIIIITAAHLHLYYKRKTLAHFPSLPIPLTIKWALGHATLISMKKYTQGGKPRPMIELFNAICDELETDTTAIFMIYRAFLYTFNVSFASSILSNHKVFSKTRTPTGAYVNNTRIFGYAGIGSDPGTHIWYHKRKAMDPAFQKKFLRIIVNDMNQLSTKLCDYLAGQKDKTRIEIYDIFIRAALEVVCKCGFNINDDFITQTDSPISQALNEVFKLIQHSLDNRTLYWIPGMYRKEKKLLKDSVHMIREKIGRHLKNRFDMIRNGDNTVEDILTHIIRGNIFDDEIDIENLLDDFFVFLIAGMETSAITMSIAMWLLVKNPTVYQNLQEEVNKVYLDKDELDFDDLSKLVYLEQVIKETLRLHPPAQATLRINYDAPCTVDNSYLPKGTFTIISQEAIQRRADLWPDPLIFNPDRFAPGSKIEPFTFMPFMVGQRSCIGKHFALLEIKLIIAKLLKEFSFYDSEPGVNVLEKETSLTSRPKRGVFIGIE